MATFASLNADNIVRRVVKIDNSFGEDESPELRNALNGFVPLKGDEVQWKQCYYSGTRRQRAADVGGTYDASHDVFIAIQPYPSWILSDDGKFEWVPPHGKWPHNPEDAQSKNIGGIEWYETDRKFYGFAEKDETTFTRYNYNFGTDIWDLDKDVPKDDYLQD